jgi:hypothetical protein
MQIQRIWSSAEHAAFTDLIRYRNRWLCSFREADSHQNGSDGRIRIISSATGEKWDSNALIADSGRDLRDPKLSITPEGKLMLLYTEVELTKERRYHTRRSQVSFSKSGDLWSRPQAVLTPHDWLWRVTWHAGQAYGVSYRPVNPADQKDEWSVSLYRSSDGIDYQPLINWEIPGHPSETTLRFLDNGDMVALVRREGAAWIGSASAPYTNWSWQEMERSFGGPDFHVLPGGRLIGCGRFVSEDGQASTHIAELSLSGELRSINKLPSSGDTSYPGVVFHEGRLWVSYYSSHEGKSSVYLAVCSI